MKPVLSIMAVFAVCGSVLAAPVQTRVWKPGADSEFEVDTQIRAWTMQDEGLDTLLDTMQSMCGINSLYMVAVMHAEHRPYKAPEFPHNPARDTWKAEDSRVTFFPEMKRYGRVKPLLSDVDWIRKTDWLQLMIDACRARGMATGAEVSHYPIPKSLIKANPDWHQRKLDGSSWSTTRFCPNNPEVREYILALFGDLAANYDLDYIQTCQHLFFRSKEVDKDGSCFCPHCISEAKKIGFDLEAAMAKFKVNPDSQPEKDNWIKLRKHSTTEFYRLISDEIAKVKMNPKCHLRYNDTYPYRRWVLEDVGMHLDEVSPFLGSLVHQDHEEQKGKMDEDFANRIAWLTKSRRLIGPDMPLICGIAPRIKATPELVKQGIKVALEHPANVNGLALKHYDGASYGLMRAFKQGMIEAGVQGLPPIIGKEVEEMELENFKRFDDYVEEWGVETQGKGAASYRFDNASGLYDIRITYFDEEKGQSKVQLFVGDKEVVHFNLDEDVGCWRWRSFKAIQVNKGDEIKLIAEARGGETVRLDFVEFIPTKPTAKTAEPIVKKWTEVDRKGKDVQYMAIDGILVHETDPTKQPQPRIVTPGQTSSAEKVGHAPSDAMVLFDGTEESMQNWTDTQGNKTKWQVVDHALQPVRKAGYLQSKQAFGSCQLHVEWASPAEVQGNGQGRGNSGIFIMGMYEVQVLDSFNNPSYPDGQAGALYGRQKPLVNASRKPGEWQSYDIIFHQPVFDEAGQVVKKATFTIFHNGVLVQDHTVLSGGTDWRGSHAVSEYEAHADKLPLKLQEHNNLTRFRNIWIRPLDV